MVNKEEQALLKQFFGQEKTWYPEKYANTFVGILVAGIGYFLAVFPYTLWEGDRSIYLYMLLLETMGLYIYMNQYVIFRENGKVKSIRQILNFLPISHRQLAIFRLKKLMRICIRMTLFAILIQTIGFIAVYRSFSVFTILIPFLCDFLCPMILVGTDLAIR